MSQDLTHWGRVTHICVSKLTIIGSGNGLSPGRRQAIIWTNAGILLIRSLGTNLSEILCKIHSFSFKKMLLKMSSAKGRLFSLGLNELKYMPIQGRWRRCHDCQVVLVAVSVSQLDSQWCPGWYPDSRHGGALSVLLMLSRHLSIGWYLYCLPYLCTILTFRI